MKKGIKTLMLVLLLILFGCTESQLEARFRERVLPSTLGSASALDKFGIRYFDEGAIVIFTGDDLQQTGYTMVGYSVFRKDFGTWRNGQSGTRGRQRNDQASTFMDYFLTDFNFQGKGPDVVFDYRLLAGEILSPSVQTIEVVLDDGTVLQDEGEGDVFAFKIEVTRSFCELRVLDNQGQSLESIVPEYKAGPLPTVGPDC